MPVLVRSFSYTPDVSFSENFLLHSLLLVLEKSFPYTPHARFSEEAFQRGVSFADIVLNQWF